MAKQKLLQNPEWQDLICEYIKKWGQKEGSPSVLPLNSKGKPFRIESINNALNPKHVLYIPEFHAKVKKAYSDFAVLHNELHKDVEFVGNVDDRMRDMARAGQSQITTYKRDDQGRVVERATKKPGIPEFLYYIAHPPQVYCAQSILLVIPNQINFVLEMGLTPEQVTFVLQIIKAFRDSAIRELEERGKDTKMLKE